jgi:hypothetical protein
MSNPTCPKCERGRLRGPEFCRGAVIGCVIGGNSVGGHLHFTCNSCGYVKTTSTKDQKETRCDIWKLHPWYWIARRP